MSSFDWERYDRHAEVLESRLEALLECEPYQSDDRKLARIYLAIARALRPLMDADLRQQLDSVSSVAGAASPAGVEASEAHFDVKMPLDSEAREFLTNLIRNIALPKFKIVAATDTLPVSRAIALGMPIDLMERIISAEYPQIPSS